MRSTPRTAKAPVPTSIRVVTPPERRLPMVAPLRASCEQASAPSATP